MSSHSKKPAIANQPNNTGLPDQLHAGIEQLSGLNMDDVRVHAGGQTPTLNAMAYSQGNDVHLGAGIDPHIGHEAAHVVQQSMGRR